MKVYIVLRDSYNEYGDQPTSDCNEFLYVAADIDKAIEEVNTVLYPYNSSNDVVYEGYLEDCDIEEITSDYCDECIKWLRMYKGIYYGEKYERTYFIIEKEI